MNDISLNELQPIKTLGAGMLGTTYLVKVGDTKYALKLQHILPSDRVQSFKKEMWREFDLYAYINQLPPSKQLFFTRLHKFEIVNDCTHIQKRPFKISDNNPFARELLRLDASKYCVKYLIDYKGSTTLEQYLYHHNPTVQQSYSILLQMCNMMLILFDGGYSHNDLHTGNIMINKTNLTSFRCLNHTVPFYGLHLTAIDYGAVMHKKFKFNERDKHTKFFLSNPEYFLFLEMFNNVHTVFSNFDKNIFQCKKQKKILPWERNGEMGKFDYVVKLVMNNHPEFFQTAKEKYLALIPHATHSFEKVEKHIQTKTMEDILKRDDDEHYFWDVLNRIMLEFRVLYPKLDSEYRLFCSYHKTLIPKEDCLEFLMCVNVNQLMRFLFRKMNAVM